MAGKIVVNADDFGKSESVNAAIAECFAKGIIHRTTLMVNMPAADAAVLLAKENGFFEHVGLHLNLTEGRPLTKEIQNNPLICDEKGNFHAGFQKTMKYRLYMDELTISQIRTELEAQLEKYCSYGLTLMHVDSHHHVHTNYPVLRALKPLAAKYGFSSIRLGRNLYHGGNPLMRLYKCWYNHAIKKICQRTTDFFGSFRDAAAYFGFPFSEKPEEVLVEKKAADSMKSFFDKNSLELMVHPMYSKQGILMDTKVPMETVEKVLGEYI